MDLGLEGSPLASPGTVLEELARLACQQEGAELWDIERTSTGGSQVLRLTVDHPEGVTLPLLERVSRRLSRALDDADPIVGAYLLECESPGPRRRLRSLDDCRRFLGERARLRLAPQDGQKKTIVGRLLAVEDDELLLRVDGGEDVSVAWPRVQAANLDQER